MSKTSNLTIVFVFLTILSINSQELNLSTFLIPSELTEDANSVVRIDNMNIEMTSQNSMTVKTEMAITVLNKLADHYADISIYYDKNKSIKSVKGYIYDAMGNEIEKIKKSDFEDYSATGGSLYSDSRLIHFDYTPTTYPYTLHFKCEYTSSNTAFIPVWDAMGGYYQSVENSKYSFTYPSDIEIRKGEFNFDDYTIESNESANTLSYEVSNVAAKEREPFAPIFKKVAPHVRIGVNKFSLEGVKGQANNWNEFGKWYYETLIKDVGEISESTKKKIRALTADVEDPIEKAKIVYEYVQDKVRYISVQVGIGGFKPMLANDVDNLSYGDCKGLSNYTMSLLDAVGVPSNVVVLYGDDDKIDFEDDFLSVQGNHMILSIPNGDEIVWLECTSQDVAFGDIAGFTDDRNVLVISPEGGEIKRTRVYDDRENLQEIIGSLIIDDNGNIEAEVEITSKGSQFDKHLGYVNSNEKDVDKMYKEFWDNINNITLRSTNLKNNKKEGVFEESVTFTATNYGAISGDRMILPLNAFNVIGYTPKRMRNRKLPVVMNRGFYDTDEVTITLPSNYKIEALANDVLVDSKYGKYEMTVEQLDETTLKYSRKWLFKTGSYPKEEYDDFRNFWRKVVKTDKSKIVLIKK